MLGIAPGEFATNCPGFQRIRVQMGALIGDDEKKQPDRREADNQQRDRPAPLDAIEPCQKRPAPLCRRNGRARGHRSEIVQLH
jgi:hypothetical protein